MTRSRRRRQSAMLLLVSTILIVDACGNTPPPSVTGVPPTAQAQPSPRPTAFEPMAYPSGGDAPCDQAQPPDADHAAYAGLLRSIRAVDARTVEFRLCAPDVAFPVRLASVAGAVNDTAWLESHVDGGSGGEQAIVHDVNGTGPYRLEAWNRGSDIALVRNDAYWGEAAHNQRLIVRWRASAGDRLAELQASSVDGIDDVDPADVETVRNDVDLTAMARPGMNVFYVGFNDKYAPFDGAAVRRAIAMGIDRDRIVRALYPPGSEVASHVSPCAVPFGCGGSAWYEFDPFRARQMLADAGFPNGFDTTIQYRESARPYLPDPTAVALELQAQLKANLNIRAELQVLPDDAYLATVDAGRADGIHLLGRSASIPDASAFLDPLFGAGASSEFGKPDDALVSALVAGSATSDAATRTDAYRTANAAIRSDVPMIPIAHAGSMIAFRADVDGALASPLGQERFAAMTPGDRGQFVWLTSAEPAGLYCADETSAIARLVCAQMSEGLYTFVPGGASVAPALATACRANPELTTWTCSLRPGVTFHDGSALDANDVVLSFAVQWDAEHPLHRGREGQFQAFIDAFGGLLNPPSR